jgi:hypothetical protein
MHLFGVQDLLKQTKNLRYSEVGSAEHPFWSEFQQISGMKSAILGICSEEKEKTFYNI